MLQTEVGESWQPHVTPGSASPFAVDPEISQCELIVPGSLRYFAWRWLLQRARELPGFVIGRFFEANPGVDVSALPRPGWGVDLSTLTIRLYLPSEIPASFVPKHWEHCQVEVIDA